MEAPQTTRPQETAASLAANESPAPAEPKPEPQPPKKTRSTLLLVAIVALVVLIGLPALGIGIWLNSGTPPPTVAEGGGKPIRPEPPPPPPPFKVSLAVVDNSEEAGNSEADLNQATARISSIAASLPPELLLTAVDGAAPDRLIVSGSRERAVDAISRIPRHERWEIRIPPGNTADSYTRQLDYFKMEIGVIGQSSEIVYLSNLSAPTPTVRTESGSGEKRLYLIWQRGSMREADEEILARAKISSAGKVVVHFCPEELENQLVQMEDEQARQAGLKKIRKTVFGIRPKEPEGYRFFVIEQKADE